MDSYSYLLHCTTYCCALVICHYTLFIDFAHCVHLCKVAFRLWHFCLWESTETKKIRMDRFSYLLLYFCSAEFFFPWDLPFLSPIIVNWFLVSIVAMTLAHFFSVIDVNFQKITWSMLVILKSLVRIKFGRWRAIFWIIIRSFSPYRYPVKIICCCCCCCLVSPRLLSIPTGGSKQSQKDVIMHSICFAQKKNNKTNHGLISTQLVASYSR